MEQRHPWVGVSAQGSLKGCAGEWGGTGTMHIATKGQVSWALLGITCGSPWQLQVSRLSFSFLLQLQSPWHLVSQLFSVTPHLTCTGPWPHFWTPLLHDFCPRPFSPSLDPLASASLLPLCVLHSVSEQGGRKEGGQRERGRQRDREGEKWIDLVGPYPASRVPIRHSSPARTPLNRRLEMAVFASSTNAWPGQSWLRRGGHRVHSTVNTATHSG